MSTLPARIRGQGPSPPYFSPVRNPVRHRPLRRLPPKPSRKVCSRTWSPAPIASRAPLNPHQDSNPRRDNSRSNNRRSPHQDSNPSQGNNHLQDNNPPQGSNLPSLRPDKNLLSLPSPRNQRLEARSNSRNHNRLRLPGRPPLLLGGSRRLRLLHQGVARQVSNNPLLHSAPNFYLSHTSSMNSRLSKPLHPGGAKRRMPFCGAGFVQKTSSLRGIRSPGSGLPPVSLSLPRRGRCPSP